MQKYFGEAIRLDKNNAADAIDILLNSLVTRVTFVVGPTHDVAGYRLQESLKWMCACTKDNLTGKTSYYEYRYK
jgi:hypothetical protein